MNFEDQHSKCECHECTQARWNMSIQKQWAQLGESHFYRGDGVEMFPEFVGTRGSVAMPVEEPKQEAEDAAKP